MIVGLLVYKKCPTTTKVYELYYRYAWFVRYNYFGKVYEHDYRSTIIVYPMQLLVDSHDVLDQTACGNVH